ncbi:hypothetical protein DL770_001413 [Monosporascus sp. CRB-9-2]|nr:hypothetical protein DL770_001413 [Monosporascus sp. CRB-9-2]
MELARQRLVRGPSIVLTRSRSLPRFTVRPIQRPRQTTASDSSGLDVRNQLTRLPLESTKMIMQLAVDLVDMEAGVRTHPSHHQNVRSASEHEIYKAPLLRDTQWKDYNPRLPEHRDPTDPPERERRLHRPENDYRRILQSKAVKTECIVAYKRMGSTHRVEWSAESEDWQMKYKIDWGEPAFIRRRPRFMKRVRNLVVDTRYPVYTLDDSDLPRYPGFSQAPARKWLIWGTTRFFRTPAPR